MQEPKRYYTLLEAAELLRMRPRALRDACRAGRITFAKLDRRTWAFTQADLNAFVERHTFQARTAYGPKPAKKPPGKATGA